jgi:hypothetical protein
MGLMTAAGWDFYRNEWWHYQLFDARRYPLVADADLPRSMMQPLDGEADSKTNVLPSAAKDP